MTEYEKQSQCNNKKFLNVNGAIKNFKMKININAKTVLIFIFAVNVTKIKIILKQIWQIHIKIIINFC